MGIKNFRHGRIRVLSGDATPLIKVAIFSMGNFQFGEDFPTNEVRDRGELIEITKGDDEPVNWSFGAKFQDKTLLRTLRDKVWDAQTESFTGLTPSANNLLTPAYDFEQNSVQGATGETIVKIANGGTPSTDNELAEAVGSLDVEGVVRVEAVAGAIQVYQPAADTDRDLVYDAVGKGTLGLDECSGSRKTIKLQLQIFDPCDPPTAADLSAGTVLETYELDNAYLTTLNFVEGDEFDELTFSGRALIDRVEIVEGETP